MSYEIFTALAIFAFVSSITPGPNNLMLMSSGATYGFKQTIPHVLGVSLGFTLMVALVGAGIIQLFTRFPISYDVLKIASITYLLYLASKISMSKIVIDSKTSTTKPFTFIQAVMFQWVNPKAWTMALTSISVYAPSTAMSAVLMVAVIFGAINLPCCSFWIILGKKMQVFLTSNKRLKAFNVIMALLLVLSLYPVFL